jgi:hypothetical protein
MILPIRGQLEQKVMAVAKPIETTFMQIRKIVVVLTSR